ncbi:hypothetical protein D9619_010317 [Psilocybe cf. subviscida]|uniref:Uncharacterized protein n=1 Tax=Psilocybe cf. subviscida TaxID=2480587 RepID=A0A8H5ASG8_9AGAR|nr:hypothetical protein D9619_010317 [Psilocybe cf. subviscida]
MLIRCLDRAPGPAMQLKGFLLAAAIVFFSTGATAVDITLFDGANCGGGSPGTSSIGTNTCLTLATCSTKSVSYNGVPNQIQFFISGGGHDRCSNGPSLVLGPGSGCATAPDGVNWESFAVF